MSVSTKHIHVEATARCWPVWAASGYGTMRPSGGGGKSGSLSLRTREAVCYAAPSTNISGVQIWLMDEMAEPYRALPLNADGLLPTKRDIQEFTGDPGSVTCTPLS